jgi:hypothetical protein
MHVSDLLMQLGLGEFAALFEAERVSSVGVLSLMTRQDFADLKVPKGAALAIMESCKQLLGTRGQQELQCHEAADLELS